MRQTTEFDCGFAATSLVRRRRERCCIARRSNPKRSPVISVTKADAFSQRRGLDDNDEDGPGRSPIEDLLGFGALRSVHEAFRKCRNARWPRNPGRRPGGAMQAPRVAIELYAAIKMFLSVSQIRLSSARIGLTRQERRCGHWLEHYRAE